MSNHNQGNRGQSQSVKPQGETSPPNVQDRAIDQPNIDQHSDELAAARAEIAELKALVQGVISRDASRASGPAAQIVALAPLNDYERRRGAFRESSERADRRAQEESDRQRNDLVKLQEGDIQFKVEMPGEPRMTRTVGAHDRFEAEAKYKVFMNIRGSGAKQIIITPLNELATA